MRISDKHEFLFVHIQKTGGMTIEAILDESMPDVRHIKGPRHLTLEQLHEKEPDLVRYWTVGFVRNPWARMLSWWSMIEASKELAEQGRKQSAEMFRKRPFWRSVGSYKDFDEFLQRGPEDHERLRMPQIDFLTTKTRRADYIGRTETLALDVRAMMARLELPVLDSVPVVNRSRTGGSAYHEHYSREGRDRIAEVFRKDIEAFAYEF